MDTITTLQNNIAALETQVNQLMSQMQGIQDSIVQIQQPQQQFNLNLDNNSQDVINQTFQENFKLLPTVYLQDGFTINPQSQFMMISTGQGDVSPISSGDPAILPGRWAGQTLILELADDSDSTITFNDSDTTITHGGITLFDNRTTITWMWDLTYWVIQAQYTPD